MIYAGIGSRQTPSHILQYMTQIAKVKAARGWILRSGGAEGADTAFEKGAQMKEIFLPWKNFNGSDSTLYRKSDPAAEEIAARHHPAWHRCSAAARRMHTRNVYQVLGFDLTIPSTCVICWTPGGLGGGGTGQAIRIARAYEVPVLDIANTNTLIRVLQRLEIDE